MLAHDHSSQNQLLAALPPAVWPGWAADLERVPLRFGQVLHEANRPLAHAYFPTSAIVSLTCDLLNDASCEIAMVGSEGVVGMSLCMGGDSTPFKAVVNTAGEAYRLTAQAFKQGLQNMPVTQLLLRYTQAFITQVTQTAVCNRHHSMDQQLCRWLLQSLDRLPGIEMTMTQERLARILGTRRESVSQAAMKLQRAAVISYVRGRLTVLDRPVLEHRCCECYSVVKQEFDRLLPAASGDAPVYPQRSGMIADVAPQT